MVIPGQHPSWASRLLTCFLVPFFGLVSRGEPVSFNRDIQPLLAENCFECHGPDKRQRKAELRLDIREGAFRNRDGIRPLVPGNLATSEIYRRITSHDLDELMPPPEASHSLKPTQIHLLEQWILEGAAWERHWAFVPPKRPALPVVSNSIWPNNSIDWFILNRLEVEGLSPSLETDRRTLIRRVALDLTGLPPSTWDIRTFLSDTVPGAYERLVDRLLQSPRYGEHMAQEWLDAARYADTNGYQSDRERTQWFWRDWVVDALNANKPFDHFTIEQLAGDLLPHATPRQFIATGFNRNHMLNGEGGAIPEETRVEYVVDRVNTTGAIWLGLTVGCARCHDHKYDPITQKEFYRLFAYFNNVPERGGGNFEPTMKVPTVDQAIELQELQSDIEKQDSVLSQPFGELADARKAWESIVQNRLATDKGNQGWTILQPEKARSMGGASLTIGGDGSVLASGKFPEQDDYVITVSTDLETITGIRLEALTHPSLKDGGPGRDGNFVLSDFDVIPGTGELDEIKLEKRFESAVMKNGAMKIDIDVSGQSTLVLEVNDAGNGISSDWANWGKPLLTGSNGSLRLTNLKWYSASTDYREVRINKNVKDQTLRIDGQAIPWGIGTHAKSRIVYLLPDGYERFTAIIGPDTGALEEVLNAQTSIQFRVITGIDTPSGPLSPLEISEAMADFSQEGLAVSKAIDDATTSGWGIWAKGQNYNQDRKAVFTLSEPFHGGKDTRLTVRLEQRFVSKRHILGRFRLSATDAASPSLETPDRIPDDIVAILLSPIGSRSLEQREQLAKYHRSSLPEFFAAQKTKRDLEYRMAQIRESMTPTMIMRDGDTPRDTFLLVRGEYNRPDKTSKIQTGVPACLPPPPKGTSANRLSLARWLTDPGHPLTARVNVNRYWQHFFGVGLVKTTEDFGTRGERPTHPELLDWLAAEFVQSGWDVKYIHRLIVTSAAYRQSSKVNPVLIEKDPENRLIARGPRFRMTAQMIRDQALALGELLVDKLGGPPVKPYQPEGVWSDFSFGKIVYKRDSGESLYRRSLYTYWRRSVRPAMFFDNPTRRTCAVRPHRTNTPLQALNLLNDTAYVEAARWFAQRILQEDAPHENKVRLALEIATGRPAKPEETRILWQRYQTLIEYYRRHPKEARKLIQTGEAQSVPSQDPANVAALTCIASLLLNLDEVITKE